MERSDPHLTLEQLERRHIERVLREEQGHVERAAKRLGISRSSLYQKIKKSQLQSKNLERRYHSDIAATSNA